ILFLRKGFRIDLVVNRSTFRWKKFSNFSHKSSSFSPRSTGSTVSISTNKSMSLDFTSNLSVVEDPNAYKDFTSWVLHNVRNSSGFDSIDFLSSIGIKIVKKNGYGWIQFADLWLFPNAVAAKRSCGNAS